MSDAKISMLERAVRALETRLAMLTQDIRRSYMLDEWSNVAFGTQELGNEALRTYLSPLLVPSPIRVAAIYQTVLTSSAIVPGGGLFGMALYKFINADSLSGVGSVTYSGEVGGRNGSRVAEFRRVLKSAPVRSNIDTSASRYMWELEREFLIDPRDGYYALAFHGHHDDCRWLGPARTGGLFQHPSWYVPTLASFVGDFPDLLTGRQVSSTPTITLRSSHGKSLVGW